MDSTGGSGANAGSECEGEDPEDSSSRSNEVLAASEGLQSLNLEDETKNEEPIDELASFRQQWQAELELETTTSKTKPARGVEDPEAISDEEKAKQLFLRGVEMERSGDLYEAIQHYKRAMQLDPDVETRLYDSTDHRDSPEVESEPEDVPVDNTKLSDDEDNIEGEDLLTRLQRIVARKGQLCEPDLNARGYHISWLPYEVVLLILRWVVSSDLDAATLERVAATCRGLYVAAREPDIWRAICVKTWGIECGTPRSAGYQSWRHMYIDRPRLLLNGCYISKTTYLRHGENSFQDIFYKPWYIIHYYRYLRFFPEGVVLMWTTPEEPAACVGQLRSRTVRSGVGIVAGHYRLRGDKVVVVVKRSNEKKPQAATNTRFRTRRIVDEQEAEKTFHCEFELRHPRSRQNFQLAWTRYAVCLRNQWTTFDLTAAKFPPLSFSRVKSYNLESTAPLI